ncbi:hypothetical protein CANCADRAFT_124475 [Tortispora caseinolytica NRRL Y-17796]|uniref:Acyl-CoA dehydrogenase/oxidase C-terminal domain-containing protein n=1 Tax=Tortispora caseinolytica NRRL Y-17796 TaxID=767744 RepID=A0A1E4T9U7_9ASCO|nr:hypothetical protein CANCADRAFT_124475 [Tortispora caseinolytica NRRL Y-17796]
MPAASIYSGFVQKQPKLENQYHCDAILKRVLKRYIPDAELYARAEPLWINMGDKTISDNYFRWLSDAEKHPPTIRSLDSFGNPVPIKDCIVTSEGWRHLKDECFSEGIVAIGYDRDEWGHYARVVQFGVYYLFSPSSAITTCPFAMTDGCARVLEVYHPQGRNHPVFKRLTSRDPKIGYTSGQWMTERSGGSDVSGTETFATKTTATRGGEPEYSVSGFKWFSSATESQVTLLLAREAEGAKLNCYLGYVHEGGVRVSRLKEKLGTKALPTAELELNGLKATKVSKDGRGVATIASVLNITRAHNCISSTSFAARSFTIAKEFTKLRKVFGKPLTENPAHLKILAAIAVKLRAMTHLAFFTISLLGKSEAGTSTEAEQVLLRLICPLAKAYIAKNCLAIVSECAEGMGGVGYLENDQEINIARLLRDSQVLTIWEGTTNVLSDDFVRLVKGKSAQTLPAINALVTESLAKDTHGWDQVLQAEMRELTQTVEQSSLEVLRAQGRSIMFAFARTICSALMIADSASDQDATAVECSRRWIAGDEGLVTGIESKAKMDYKIVFG